MVSLNDVSRQSIFGSMTLSVIFSGKSPVKNLAWTLL
jgi:hypothetical protein